MNRILPRMTPARAAWLRHLIEHGPAESHSLVGYACRKLRWTEWASPIGTVPRDFRERITAAGRAALATHEE